MAKTEYPILFNFGTVGMKSQSLGLVLVIKYDLNLAFRGRKPVPELLRYGEKAFLQAAGGRSNGEALFFGTHTRMALMLQ